MGVALADPELGAAFDEVDTALDRLLGVGVEPVDGRDALAVIERAEVLERRAYALQVAVVGAIDRRALFKEDGHASAKVLVRHVANLSDAEAGRRAKVARALRDLPGVADALAAGRIGRCQVERIARAHANRRVREQLIGIEDRLVELAASRPYREFDGLLSNWVRMVDEDGTCDRSRHRHENRRISLRPDFDGGWSLSGGCGSLEGAEAKAILDAFVQVEFDADWAAARALHGDAATVDDLARTDAQRRWDAHLAIYRKAASVAAAEPGGSEIVTDIVIDQDTFERHTARIAGTEPAPRSNVTLDDAEAFRCHTIDGDPIDPTEAVTHALIHKIRRVVLDSKGVVINLGRTRRLFTGSAQLAVHLGRDTCYWPGCHVPTSHCQADHLQPWTDDGQTNPDNGGPLCGRHNRYRNHGYTTWRDPTGTWHITRPDGSEIPGYPRPG